MIDTLAWSLLHFLWQGAAIAAVAGALMLAFRKPAARYVIGMVSLVTMLVAFGITFSTLSGASVPAADAMTAGTPAAVSARNPGATVVSTPSAHSAEVEPQAAFFPGTDFRWVAWLWLAGVCVLAVRVAFGVLALEHLRRHSLGELPASLVSRFQALARRLGIRRAIQFCECRLVNVPAVIGLFRPIVLVPMRALTGLSSEQLEAVIAHELGHIRRFDVIANFFQVIAETLFFFHPAVWWLNRRIRAVREDCCDDIAVGTTGGSRGYAHALATMAGWRDAPELAMAATGSPVAARVARLLGMHQRGSGRTTGMFTASVVLAGALVAGAASVSLAQPAPAETPVVTATPAPVVRPQIAIKVEPVVSARPVVSAQPAVEMEIAVPMKPPVPTAPGARPPNPPQVAPTAEPAVPPPGAPVPVAPPPPRPKGAALPPGAKGSYLAEMQAAGIDGLDVDTLIAFKSQGVDAEFIRQIRATGLDPNADEIMAMKVHGVDPAYVQKIRDMGYKPDADEIIALRVHDVSSDYVKVMRELGVDPDVDQLVALKSQGVSPEYVRQMRSAGFTPDTDELIAMKVLGVTPELRREFESAGFKLSIDELLQARAMDVTPEFAAKVKAHGFKQLDFDQLVALKSADVL